MIKQLSTMSKAQRSVPVMVPAMSRRHRKRRRRMGRRRNRWKRKRRKRKRNWERRRKERGRGEGKKVPPFRVLRNHVVSVTSNTSAYS